MVHKLDLELSMPMSFADSAREGISFKSCDFQSLLTIMESKSLTALAIAIPQVLEQSVLNRCCRVDALTMISGTATFVPHTFTDKQEA